MATDWPTHAPNKYQTRLSPNFIAIFAYEPIHQYYKPLSGTIAVIAGKLESPWVLVNLTVDRITELGECLLAHPYRRSPY